MDQLTKILGDATGNQLANVLAGSNYNIPEVLLVGHILRY